MNFSFSKKKKKSIGKSGALVSILQLLISNVIFAPIENYIYLYSMAYINGKQGSDIQKSISQGFWPMMYYSFIYF